MASANKSPFQGIRCPACGAAESLNVAVETLVLSCSECGDDVSRAQVDRMIAQWGRLFAWLDAAK